MLAFQLERKVVGKMSTLMVAAKEPKGVWIPDLKRPKIEHALLHNLAGLQLTEKGVPTSMLKYPRST